MTVVPPELEALAAELLPPGFKVCHYESGHEFGNFVASFASLDRNFAIVRDRGQFHIEYKDQAELEQVGLWRSFAQLDSLSAPLLAWLRPPNAA